MFYFDIPLGLSSQLGKVSLKLHVSLSGELQQDFPSLHVHMGKHIMVQTTLGRISIGIQIIA